MTTTRWLVCVSIACLQGCGIANNDPFPAFGRPCAIAEGTCDVDHVCRPDAAGSPNGVCVPIASFGACDADAGPPAHSPGRQGELVDQEAIDIASVAQMELLDQVRIVTGSVIVFEPGPDDAVVGDLCTMRTLQVVGDGFGVGDSDVTTLDGLQSLTSVENGVAIFNNRELTSIAALDNLAHVTPRRVNGVDVHVIIAGNVELPQADVDAFAAALRTRTADDGLRVIACGNDGPNCEGEELDLLTFISVNGLRE